MSLDADRLHKVIELRDCAKDLAKAISYHKDADVDRLAIECANLACEIASTDGRPFVFPGRMENLSIILRAAEQKTPVKVAE